MPLMTLWNHRATVARPGSCKAMADDIVRSSISSKPHILESAFIFSNSKVVVAETTAALAHWNAPSLHQQVALGLRWEKSEACRGVVVSTDSEVATVQRENGAVTESARAMTEASVPPRRRSAYRSTSSAARRRSSLVGALMT